MRGAILPPGLLAYNAPSFYDHPMRMKKLSIKGLPGVLLSPAMIGRLLWPSIIVLGLLGAVPVAGQISSGSDDEFGPVMKAYLGYLRNEQEVVDDRVSRREVSRAYYRRNSNRIRALRQISTRIVLATGNDYIPELEAITRDEMRNLFEVPPATHSLELNRVLNNTFRFLGVERAGEAFYVFERLNPYEQAELMEKAKNERGAPRVEIAPQPPVGSRPRRAVSRN